MPISFLRTIDDDLTTTSVAAFAPLHWEFVPTWTLAAGVRWTRDQKEYDRSTSPIWGRPFRALNETLALSAQHDWTAATPTARLQTPSRHTVTRYWSEYRGVKQGGHHAN